jgi:hypothetical protein
MDDVTDKPKRRRGGGPRANTGGARPGAGHPPLSFTDHDRKQVEALAGYGVPAGEIASLVCGGISKDTLYKYFLPDLTRGRASANAEVGKLYYNKVLEGKDTAALIWWTKSRMGWKETERREHVIEHPALAAMSDEELLTALEERLGKLQIEAAANAIADGTEVLALTE